MFGKVSIDSIKDQIVNIRSSLDQVKDFKELSLAAEAYLYGYPLVYTIHETINLASPRDSDMIAPVNVFSYARELLGPEVEFVSANNDTIYAMAAVDVTAEAQVLHLPDTHDRYYVMQFVDAWTNNFAYLGRRSTGTKEGFYLLAGPNWAGEIPDGVRLVRAPTNVFTLVGRFATTGGDDLAAAIALEEDTWLTPLSRYPSKPDNSGRTVGDWELAPFDKRVADDLKFWEQMRSWMRMFPPSVQDQEYQAKFEPLGLLADGWCPYHNPDPALADTLKAGEAEFKTFLEANLMPGEPMNGWNVTVDAFNYNMDHLGVGTLDTPEWKMSNRTAAYFLRAVVARLGLWGNHSYEAFYPQVFLDENDEQLNGSRQYVLHFDELPPVDAFWSITMYNIPNFYLVANPIKRYSIGDRTPGLKYNEDGSLDIYLQKDSPGPEKESNWLPCPAGDFRPILRMYQPRPEALADTFELPPIRRVE